MNEHSAPSPAPLAATRAGSELLAVVVTYNSEDHIERCLEAVLSSGLYNAVIIDNASTDATLRKLDQWKDRLRVIVRSDNIGFGAAVNEAVREANWSGHVLCLNPDAVINSPALKSITKVLCDMPNTAVVAPQMCDLEGRNQIYAGGAPSILKEVLAFARIDDLVPEFLRRSVLALLARAWPRSSVTDYLRSQVDGSLRQYHWVSGYCMLIRDRAWESLGGFDTRYFLYFEDADLCARARAAGWDVVGDGRTAVAHVGSASTTSRAKRRLYRDGLWRYLAAHGTRTQRAIARICAKK